MPAKALVLPPHADSKYEAIGLNIYPAGPELFPSNASCYSAPPFWNGNVHSMKLHIGNL